MADSDVQVWLDTVERTRPGIVVPYVQSERAQSLRYRVRVVQDGNNGRAVIGQSGAISLFPNTPAALSQFSLSREPGAQCKIEITLKGT
ncbi:MAG: hypothetical protein GX772_01050, partial [Alcaligenaceae bacterium]|nr:hypothetical protein [Alcaligenaceae bacterium]